MTPDAETHSDDVRRENPPGRLIAVEGVDGSGKSTQIDLLHKWLRAQGLPVFFSEWNSSDLVKGATKAGKKRHLLTPTTFSLIHATDFADRYERQILPMLHAGRIVLCDRYMYTSFARDGARGCDPDWLEEVYRFARAPDLTMVFHVPVPVALQRILTGRSEPNYFEAGMDLGLSDDPRESFRIFQQRVTDRYTDLESTHGLVRIDGTLPIHEQQEQVRRLVVERLGIDVDPAGAVDQIAWPAARRSVGGVP